MPKTKSGVLDSNARAHIKDDNFAMPGRRYPIENASHARNALARVSQHGSVNEKKRVRAAVHRKYPGIEESTKLASGGLMNNDKMMSDLMKRRKAKQEGDQSYDYDLMDQDSMPKLHEQPDDAEMNNQSPDLREQSADLGLDDHDPAFDNKLSAEGDESMRESALYADGGVIDSDEDDLSPNGTIANRDVQQHKPGNNDLAPSGKASQKKAPKNYADGGSVPPAPPIDPKKAQQVSDSFKSAFAKGGDVKMAYGQGRLENDQEDDPQLHDEDSSIAMAEGGIAYNSNLKENYPDDSDLVTDERSRIVFADGGKVRHAKRLEPDMEDTPEDHDEDSSIAMAQGGTVQGAKHLEPNDVDTRESKDEASSITLARGGVAYNGDLSEDEGEDPPLLHNEEQYAEGGNVAYTDIDEHDQEDTPMETNEADEYAGGGQVDNDQGSGRNPKSMQSESQQDKAMKARRRKLMISALNE